MTGAPGLRYALGSVFDPEAIFQRQGDLWTPTEYAQGPWNPDHVHGGPVCAMLAHAVEACESPAPMRVARLTVEMTRAVPRAPLRVAAEVTRSGRRIQQVDARIEADGVVVARATALRMRIGESHPDAAIALDEPVPPRTPAPDDYERLSDEKGMLFFPGFIKALDFVRSAPPTPGEAGVSWARQKLPFVAGEETTPFVRLALLCDFASGTGNALDFRRFTSINPDLSLHVRRLPRGEWIGIRAKSHLEPDGIGQSHAILFDEEGAVARALVSLLVEPRGL